MKKPVVAGICFLLLVLGVILYSSMNMSAFRVEVCMDFQGRTSCRTVSGAAESSTLREAITNACGEIASGVTDTIACQNTPPVKTTWLKRTSGPAR